MGPISPAPEQHRVARAVQRAEEHGTEPMTQKKNVPKAADSRPTLGGRKVHRIVFVTGKGGVGKSAVAAATALRFARAGKTVLLVELGSRSFYGPLLGLPVGADTVRWTSRIGITRWDVESALREYVAHYLVFKAAADRILNYTVMKALMAAAPSLAELAILGKLTGPMRHAWYQRDVDVVVVDAYATGQFMALLRAPRGLSQTAGSGPMHRHTMAMTALLSEPAICEYRLVTLAEEMPTAEACEMARDLRAETGIAPRIYCNRLIDLPQRLPMLPQDDPAAPFVQHMARVAERQRDSLAALQALANDRDGPIRRLPLIPATDAQRLLRALADALDVEPGAA
jgi:anion-transporting  ArsA/GET3 family ATPase